MRRAWHGGMGTALGPLSAMPRARSFEMVTHKLAVRVVQGCRALRCAWLRRVKKYFRLSRGFIKRLRDLASSFRVWLRGPLIGLQSEAASSTNGTTSVAGPDAEEPWCTLAYWELNERVGPLYPVNGPWLHVSYDEAPGSTEDTLSLGLLAKARTSPCKDAVARTRAKIGLGVTLLRERDGVWVYNRSEHAVFVNSPTLDGPHVRNLTVFRVAPGYSLRIFDWERAQLYRHHYRRHPADGPFDPDAVRISFVKGWGPKYTRQIVTACPCSLEVLFRAPAR